MVVKRSYSLHSRFLAVPLLLIALSAGCASSKEASRYSRKRAQVSLTKLQTPGLVIGEFALAGKPVVDGDTIHVEGLDASLRLIGLDAEETIKDKNSRHAVDQDFDQYLHDKRGDSKNPVKAGTPMGEAAKEFAVGFFTGITSVRLERDEPKEIRDRYNRYLAYVWVNKDGRWQNYNVECVRAGMSPYFTKYSYSRRYHQEFVAAEKEAKAAQRGIWNPSAQGYKDYAEREVWWQARAEFVKQFEREAAQNPNFISLGHWDSLAKIDSLRGQEVTVLATIGEIKLGDKGPTRVILSRRMFNDLAAVFFDSDVFMATGLAACKGEYVRVTGVVSEYQNKYNKQRQLQLIVNLPSQVMRCPKASFDQTPAAPAPSARPL